MGEYNKNISKCKHCQNNFHCVDTRRFIEYRLRTFKCDNCGYRISTVEVEVRKGLIPRSNKDRGKWLRGELKHRFFPDYDLLKNALKKLKEALSL